MSCLIVERHAWETGEPRQQIQFPREAFDRFFGVAGDIAVEIYASPWRSQPTRRVRAQVSLYQRPSGTCRLNKVFEISNVGPVFVLLQELPAEQDGLRSYDLWWERDVALVAAKFDGWRKARDSQHGRGRVWTIVDRQVQRPVAW